MSKPQPTEPGEVTPETLAEADRAEQQRLNELDAIIAETERNFQPDVVLEIYANREAYNTVATALAQSGMTHHKRPEHVITIAIAAKEFGIGLMEALRGMYVVGGKIACETWLMDRLAIRLGVRKVVVVNDYDRAEVILRRPGHADVTSAFTLEDAHRAGLILAYSRDDNGRVLIKPAPRREVWKAYPKNMLLWRAIANGLRLIAPDMFGGVYTPDEVAGFRGPTSESGEASSLTDELGGA